MAVGYHKINTSAARSKRRDKYDPKSRAPVITPAKTRFTDPTYGPGATAEGFVSDCDTVSCLFDSGAKVNLRGGGIRYIITHESHNSEKK